MAARRRIPAVQKGVGRTGGGEALGQPLAGIKEVGEGPAVGAGLGLQPLWPVLGMAEDAVAGDGDQLHLRQVALQTTDLRLDVLHEGAVGADEEHQQRPAGQAAAGQRLLQIRAAAHLPGTTTGQFSREQRQRQGRTQGHHLRRGENHGR